MNLMNLVFSLSILFIVQSMLVSCQKKNAETEPGPEVIGQIADADGNLYKAVKIANQIWMGENLKTSRLHNNTVVEYWDNVLSDQTAPAYCVYNHDLSNKQDYGFLYNYAAVQTNTLCPEGFRIPSKNDWLELAEYLGGVNIAGGKLKEAGTIHWNSPNTRATNESLMNILPGGNRLSNNEFNLLEKEAHLWTSTDASASEAFSVMLSYTNSVLTFIDISFKTNAYSVRCMRNIQQ